MHIPHIIKKGHCTMKDMFCFQCQQTAHNTGCEGKAGVCGKKADTANYQDEIIGALIGLARAAKNGRPTESTDALVVKSAVHHHHQRKFQQFNDKSHQDRGRAGKAPYLLRKV